MSAKKNKRKKCFFKGSFKSTRAAKILINCCNFRKRTDWPGPKIFNAEVQKKIGKREQARLKQNKKKRVLRVKPRKILFLVMMFSAETNRVIKHSPKKIKTRGEL